MTKKYTKDTNNKSTCTKNKYRYTAEEVAKIAGVSASYVNKIRQKTVDLKALKAQEVLIIDQTLYDGSTKLLREVERIMR